jgi:hypothetical protein
LPKTSQDLRIERVPPKKERIMKLKALEKEVIAKSEIHTFNIERRLIRKAPKARNQPKRQHPFG